MGGRKHPNGAAKLLTGLEIPFNRDFLLSGEWVFRSDNDTMNQQYSKFTGQMGNLCQLPHALPLRLNDVRFL